MRCHSVFITLIYFSKHTGLERVYKKKIPNLIEKVESGISQSIFSKTALDMRQEGHKSLETLWRSVLHRAYDLRKNDAKRSVKKKAFTDLLKLLKSIGLSHHKSTVPKVFFVVNIFMLISYYVFDEICKFFSHG